MLSSTLLLLSWQPLMSLQYTLAWWVNKPLILWYFIFGGVRGGGGRKKNTSFLSLSVTPTKSLWQAACWRSQQHTTAHWIIHTINNYIHNWKKWRSLNCRQICVGVVLFQIYSLQSVWNYTLNILLQWCLFITGGVDQEGVRSFIFIIHADTWHQIFQLKFALKDAKSTVTSAQV